MTVETTTNLAVFRGNGVADEFDFGFKVLETDHLIVQRRVYATGEIDKTYVESEYTISGLGDDVGGSITLLAGALADTYEIILERIVSIKQELDIVNQGGFFPETVENQLDMMTMGIQQANNRVNRALVLPAGEEGVVFPVVSERANKYPVFLADGSIGVSEGTGSDAALRGDLANNANVLVRTVYPGFPAIVSTLGDFLPTIAASTFFGIRSNGSTDDTVAWNVATEAMEHSTNPKGRTIFNEPGEPSLIEGQVVVRPGVGIDLRGGMFDAQFVGGIDPAIRMMTNSALRGGSVIVDSTTPGASQDMAHAAIGFGAMLGLSGTAAAPSEYATVINAHLSDLLVSTSRDAGVAISIIGDVSGCVIERVRVAASALMRGPISIDWGVVGETVFEGDTVQGIWSDANRQQLNRDAYDDWVADNATGAYTTHPRNNTVRDFIVGALTRTYTGTIDTGTFLARVSGSHGNSFYNFVGEQTTEAGLIHEAGDMGYEYARPQDIPHALMGNVFDGFEIRNAHRGYATKLTSLADNLNLSASTNQLNAAGADTGVPYVPARPALHQCDLEVHRLRAYTAQGVNALEGLYLANLNGGKIVGPRLYGFKNNLRASASKADIVGFRGSHSWQHGMYLHDACTGIRLIDTKQSEYSGQATANTWDDLHVGASTGTMIDGGTYGADSATPRCKQSICFENAADGVTKVIIKGTPTANAHGAANVAVKLGASANDQTLAWEVTGGFFYGSNVSSKYDGLQCIPIKRRINTAGGILTDWDVLKANALANQVVAQGDRFWIINPVSGEVALRIGVASATLDGTGSDRDTITETMGVLS